MQVVKYNKRAGKLTPVIRQVKSKRGMIFHITQTNAGIMVQFPSVTRFVGEWRYLRDIDFEALASWLWKKTK